MNTNEENYQIQLLNPFRLLHIIQRPAGFFMDLHSHVFYHIILIEKGNLTIELQDKKTTVTEGQVVIIPPKIPHRLYSENGYRQIGIDVFDCADSRGVIDMFKSTFVEGFAVINTHQFPYTFEYAMRSSYNLTALNILKTTNICESFILELIEQVTTVSRNKFRDRFIDMCATTSLEKLTLEFMYTKMNLSKTHLEKLVRKEFDCSAVEYVLRLKINRACFYLGNTDMVIKEICELLNFYDESHFNYFFKKRMHITPLSYRKSSRSKAHP